MANEPTIEQMNEAIAVFDGGVLIPDCSIIDDDLKRKYWQFGKDVVAADKLKYHKSWDAITPIVKKIKGMHLDILKQSFVMAYMHAAGPMNSAWSFVDIEKLHKGIYQFITWYNQQKQNNG